MVRGGDLWLWFLGIFEPLGGARRDGGQRQQHEQRQQRPPDEPHKRLELRREPGIAEQQRREAPKPPDMLADPDAWQQHLWQQQRGEIDRARFELSEDMARDKFGDQKVDEALTWLKGNLDPVTQQRITTARNPYRELVKLYDERQTLQQIGGDLGAYKTKLLDDALNDPGFMEKVAAKLREQQGGSNGSPPTNGQRPVVQLPPSLSRTTGSRISEAVLSESDMKDENLWAHATAPEPRRQR